MVPSLNLTAIAAAAALLALAAAGYNYQRAEKFQEQRDSAIEKSNLLASELTASNSTIARCDTANKALFSQAERASAQMSIAAASAEHFAQEAAKARIELQQKEEQDRVNPNCQIILQGDLAGVCPGHAESMRQRSEQAPRLEKTQPRKGSEDAPRVGV